MHRGWYQVAYERDLREGLNAVSVDCEEVALLARGSGVTAFDAYCPHRGAHLCHGGVAREDHVVCPFHGFKIGIGKNVCGFEAGRFDCMVVGGLVFVRAPGNSDDTFRTRIEAMDATHFIVPGFQLTVDAPADLVVENAFDATHFRPVHRVMNQPSFAGGALDNGSYVVEGVFRLPPSPWQTKAQANGVNVPFRATAYSPTIVLSDLGGERPYSMLTATQPVGERRCVIRLSLLIAVGPNRTPPREEDCQDPLRQARAGIDQDVVIWNHIRWPLVFSPVESDQSVIGFKAFCQRFGPDAASVA